MDKEPDDNVPDLLRRRILRQRKRLKIVRFTFALTAALSVLLLFAANQSQSLAPSSRTIHIIDYGDTTWLLDQHLDVAGQGGVQGGSFGLVRIEDDEIATGTRFDGIAVSVARVGDDAVGITTSGRYMELNTGEDGWPRESLEPLGLNDPLASPVAFAHGGEVWLCWVDHDTVMLRPFHRREVEPKAVHKLDSGPAGLRAQAANGKVWLSIREDESGDLSMISFTPSITEAEDEDEEGETAPPLTAVEIHHTHDVTGNVARSSFAVVEGRPVVGVLREESSTREWNLFVWTPGDDGEWREGESPPREAQLSGFELSNFLSLAGDGAELVAIFNDGGDVMTSRSRVAEDGGLDWSEPELLALDGNTGAVAYVVWVAILFGFLVLMAGQGVWLLLNRERTMDRTLAEILDKQEAEDGKKKKKDEPRLPYANGLARALALLLDIAMTSPVIILLQNVYDYTWEQAYGFLAIGSVSTMDVNLVAVIEGTLVTLMVLALYGMVCEYFWGKTFGKAMFRLRVVNAKGEQPSAWRIAVRNFVKIFELIHWIVLLVPMALMMMTGKQQRLGDLLGGTFVIVEVVPEESPDDIDV